MLDSLNIYIGTKDSDSWEDFLYLDLCRNGEEIPMASSKDSLNDSSEEDFFDELRELSRQANLLSSELNIPVKYDSEGLREFVDEFSSESKKRLYKIVKGVDYAQEN